MVIPAGQLAPGQQRRRRRDPGATREALLSAAADQFAVAGFEGASVTSILAGSGLSRGSLYYHFPHKEGIAEAVIREGMDRKRAASRTAFDAAPDPLSGLLEAVTVGLEVSLSDPIVHAGDRLLDDPQVPAHLAAENYQHSTEHIRGLFEVALRAGVVRDTADLDLITSTVVALAAGHRLICERTDATDVVSAQMNQVWRALLPLIATDEWLAAPLPQR